MHDGGTGERIAAVAGHSPVRRAGPGRGVVRGGSDAHGARVVRCVGLRDGGVAGCSCFVFGFVGLWVSLSGDLLRNHVVGV